MQILFRTTEKLAHWLALVGFTGLLVLAIMVVADIVLRAVIDFPLKGVNDVAAVVMAVVVAACIPNALLQKQNINIEVLGNALGGRARATIEALASLAVLAFFTALAWKFIPYAASITASGEETWVLKLPVGPWWWVATAFFWVAVLVQAMVALTDVLRIFGVESGFKTPGHAAGEV